MKKLQILLLLVVTTGVAQIKGNGELVERSFPIETIRILEINLTADFILDANNEDEITIKTDSNLIDYISRDFENGYLNISQVKWIQPTKRPLIKIGISSLKKLINDAHSTSMLLNINQDTLEVIANVGKINLSGAVNQLDLIVGTASVRAKDLIVQNANVRITGFGKAHLNVLQNVKAHIVKNGRLSFVNEPTEIAGNYSDPTQTINNTKVSFINIKLKNNSWGRNKYMVVGPNPDGSSFSYGFELWPLQSKKERWTIGSQIYRINSFGKRRLVIELTENNKNEIVKLF